MLRKREKEKREGRGKEGEREREREKMYILCVFISNLDISFIIFT